MAEFENPIESQLANLADLNEKWEKEKIIEVMQKYPDSCAIFGISAETSMSDILENLSQIDARFQMPNKVEEITPANFAEVLQNLENDLAGMKEPK